MNSITFELHFGDGVTKGPENCPSPGTKEEIAAMRFPSCGALFNCVQRRSLITSSSAQKRRHNAAFFQFAFQPEINCSKFQPERHLLA